METRLTKKDMGCWIDGTFGSDHRNKKLIDFVCSFHDETNRGNRSIINGLLSKDQEIVYDAVDDAVDFLNSLCDDDVEFFWIDGDLILSTCELIGEYQ